jgi:iron complex outermembrane receptor protein
MDVILVEYNKYEGSHFGKVIWSRYASTSELGDRYYDDFATKQMEIFSLKQIIKSNKLSLFGDLIA